MESLFLYPFHRWEGASLVIQWHQIHLPMQETQGQSLGQEDPLKKEMATHPSIHAWGIPWTEDPGCSPWVHTRAGQNIAIKQQQLRKLKLRAASLPSKRVDSHVVLMALVSSLLGRVSWGLTGVWNLIFVTDSLSHIKRINIKAYLWIQEMGHPIFQVSWTPLSLVTPGLCESYHSPPPRWSVLFEWPLLDHHAGYFP